ncbi:hypothetical protein IJG04_00590 [Candidatus Saccharibacteria bacterium]|nr:hypothetical protein [Candidatus Saccharibacteria bacterium]
MKKKVVLMMMVACFLTVFGMFGLENTIVMARSTDGVEIAVENTENTENTDNASGLTSKQKAMIIDNCASIKESLQVTQRNDARARVYLGRYYETILTDFITPLNLRLVENNISNAGLIENQSSFATQRTAFINDYIGYQQGLEDLVAIDCKAEPDRFYNRLEKVRELRAKVKKDTTKLRSLITEHSKLVKEQEAKL